MNKSDKDSYDEITNTLTANIAVTNLLKESNTWAEYGNMDNVNVEASTRADTFNNHTNDLHSYMFKQMAEKSYEDGLWHKFNTTNFANV